MESCSSEYYYHYFNRMEKFVVVIYPYRRDIAIHMMEGN